MSEQIKISAKNLGYTALPDFCPRCFWLRIKTNFKMPYSTFPGIFSSIDAYTKHCVHHMIDSHNQPIWMQQLGMIVGYEKTPHWSKNIFHDEKTNINLSGAVDDILVRDNGQRVIVDWKTQRHSDTQDKLFDLYQVQLNVYSVLFNTTESDGLYLVYMEPCSDASYAPTNIIDCGFRMCFSGVVVPVTRDRGVVRKALNTTREIFEMKKPPHQRDGCKDCNQLDEIIDLLIPDLWH